jgi:large subunit ribosomal protein L22
MKAIARFVRITPKKMNLIAHMVRNLDAEEALKILEYTPKKGAHILAKVLASAVANAENNFKQERTSLFVKEIVVTKAPSFKRGIPASKGRIQPIVKRNSHVTVMIGVKEGDAKAEPKKAEKKDVATKEAKATKKSTAKKAAK